MFASTCSVPGRPPSSTLTPAANTSQWLTYIQDLANRPANVFHDKGVVDVIARFPLASGTGSFQLGIRISPRPDGTFDLVTLLTKQ
jgi:hypothetical protein